jgi:hypothetical protein
MNVNPMINCERKGNGGTIRVVSSGQENTIDFFVSDSGVTPLTLSVTEHHGNEPRITVALVESLVQRYNSPVVWFTTKNAELRYTSWFSNSVYRYTTKDETSLYTKPFKDGNVFSRIYAMSEAMSNYCLIKPLNEELQIFDRYSILSKFRKALKPMEFISIKEESDHNIQTVCVKATREIIESGKKNLSATKGFKKGFAEVLECLETTQEQSAIAFDTKVSYMREVVTRVCLPAIVIFGSGNAFTQAVTGAFARGTGQYVKLSEEMLDAYEQALKYSD